MEVLYPRCAGLDVHSRRVNACVRVAAGRHAHDRASGVCDDDGGPARSGGMADRGGLHARGDGGDRRVLEAGVAHPRGVVHAGAGQRAAHIRNVPGRKSDRNDAAWIADLLAHGLIRGSFVPPTPIQELRDLTRTRKQLVGEITRHTQRLQKTLEDANVKLTRIVTDMLSASGRAILAAIVAGEADPERLADCTTGRLKASRADIVAAVHGRVTSHHRFLLKLHLAQIDALIAAVQQVEHQADEVLRPFREAADRLTTIPGFSETVARVIISEIGVDMTRPPRRRTIEGRFDDESRPQTDPAELRRPRARFFCGQPVARAHAPRGPAGRKTPALRRDRGVEVGEVDSLHGRRVKCLGLDGLYVCRAMGGRGDIRPGDSRGRGVIRGVRCGVRSFGITALSPMGFMNTRAWP